MTLDDRQDAAARTDSQGPDDDHDFDEQYAAWLLSCDAELSSSGSTSKPPESTLLSADQASLLREAAECLSLLDAAARAGHLDSLVKQRPAAIGSASAAEFSLRQIGRFEILRELGRGGYGVVFLAFDPRLRRQVALKVPRPEALVTPDLRNRFLREAEAAGTLAHSNLITVYETGADGPLCYIATEYCAGPTLAQWLQRHPSPVPAKTAAFLIAALTDGVAYAHSHAVLHRDIKPSNVLLAPSVTAEVNGSVLPLAEYSPKLTDFGLAKLLERNDDETRTGTVLGTPAYMAPEQAMGRTHDISAATDIYALGVLLYEMLCGRPPFRGASDPDTLRKVCSDEPPTLRVRALNTPRDLEAIVLKCLEKNPLRRYSSAETLAADLRRFLDGQPTLARPARTLERIAKWVRRRPATAGLIAVCTSAATLLAAGGWLATIRTQAALRVAEQHRAQAENSEQTTRRILYASEVSRAMAAWEANDPQQARQLLEKQIPASHQEDLREFAWRYAWHATHEEESILRGHESDVLCVRFSPDGKLLATAGKDRMLRLWHPRSGKPLSMMAGHTGEVTALAFSPDGKYLVSVGEDGLVIVWNVTERRSERVIEIGHELLCVDYSPDGSRLSLGGISNKVYSCSTTDWQPIPIVVGPFENVHDVLFWPDSSHVITASDDGPVRIWNMQTGQCAATLIGHHQSVRAVATYPKSRSVVSVGREDGVVRLWEVPDLVAGTNLTIEAQKTLTSYHSWLYDVAVAGDDRSIITAARDGAVRRLNINTGESDHAFNGHTGRVWSIDTSPDGQQLATAGEDKTVRIWPLQRLAHVQFKVDREANALYVGGDAAPIIVNASDRQVHLARLDGANAWTTITTSNVDIGRGADQDELCDSRSLQVARHEDPTENDAGAEDVPLVAVAQSAASLAMVFDHGEQVLVRDLDHNSDVARWDLSDLSANNMQIANDGTRLAVADATGKVQVREVATGRIVASTRIADASLCIFCFSPDGERLAIHTTPSLRIGIWDYAKQEAPQWLETAINEDCDYLAFSPDGTLVATGSSRVVKLWNSDAGSLKFTLSRHARAIVGLAFSEDSRTLASLSDDKMIKLWDTSTGEQLISLNPRGGAILGIAFDRNSDCLYGFGRTSIHCWSGGKSPIEAIKISQ